MSPETNFASELARSYAFRRAKERAKSSGSTYSSPIHRFSTNEDSKNKSTLCGSAKTSRREINASPLSLLKDETIHSKKAIENLRQCVMEKHLNTGTIWDQEFPSMCSYGSDYDPSKSPRLLLESLLATPKLHLEKLNEHSEADHLDLSNLESFCIKTPASLNGLQNSAYQNDKNIDNLYSLQEDNANANEKPDKRRRGRNNISISASIPPDIHGVVADSIAVVKVSCYPYDDFRESMIEMIEEQNFSLLDLEELLYCYFCLNSPEHYDLIREAFFAACNQFLCYDSIP